MDHGERKIGALYLEELMRHMLINAHALPMDKWYEVKELCPYPDNSDALNMYELALRYAAESELFIRRGNKYRMQPIDYEKDVILPGRELAYA
jgi:hypothetical protein